MDAGCTLPLRNYKAVLEASYIGTHFGLGWQRQSDAVESASRGNGSIQRSLEDAAACVLPAVLAQWQAQGGAVPPPPQDVVVAGHGRTDRGVHARQHPFYLKWKAASETPMDESKATKTTTVSEELAVAIANAVNVQIEGSLTVGSGLRVNARRFKDSGKIVGKTYSYVLHCADRPKPGLSPYSWFVPSSWGLQLDAMHEAAAMLEGTHYFGRFAADASNGGSRKTTLTTATLPPKDQPLACPNLPPSLMRTLHHVAVHVLPAEGVAASDFQQLFQNNSDSRDSGSAIKVQVDAADDTTAVPGPAVPGPGGTTFTAAEDGKLPPPQCGDLYETKAKGQADRSHSCGGDRTNEQVGRSGSGSGSDAGSGSSSSSGSGSAASKKSMVVVIEFTGDGFLKRMARCLARAVVAAGERALALDHLEAMLRHPDSPSSSGTDGTIAPLLQFAPAPPHGLWLRKTWYEPLPLAHGTPKDTTAVIHPWNE